MLNKINTDMEKTIKTIKVAKEIAKEIASAVFGIWCWVGIVWVCSFDAHQIGKWLCVLGVIVAVGAVLWFGCGVREKWTSEDEE
jgi:hypothetical protein